MTLYVIAPVASVRGYSSSGNPDTMTITGVNFGALTGFVTLNGFVQAVTTWTPNHIVARAATGAAVVSKASGRGGSGDPRCLPAGRGPPSH